jgi:heme A synthase
LVLGATLRHSATWDQELPTPLLVAHICGAVLVTLVLASTIASVALRFRGENYLIKPASIAAVLLVAQLGLGLGAYVTRMRSPSDPQPLTPMVAITVAHVACGALVFAATIVLTLRVFRLVRADQSEYRLAPA